jgi:hypothetical protein
MERGSLVIGSRLADPLTMADGARECGETGSVIFVPDSAGFLSAPRRTRWIAVSSGPTRTRREEPQ